MLEKVYTIENIRRPVGVVPITGGLSQSLRSRVEDGMHTPVGFGRSTLGKDTLDNIASENFLKSARN